MELQNITLSEEEIQIAKIQKHLASLGWRWVEETFNDQLGPNDVYLRFTKITGCLFFTNNTLGDYAWGRQPRSLAWLLAYNALIQIKE